MRDNKDDYVVFNNNTYTQQGLLSTLYIIPAVRMFVCLFEENKSIYYKKKYLLK